MSLQWGYVQKRLQTGLATLTPVPSVQPLTAFSELLEEALVTTDNGSRAETTKGINEGFCGQM